MGQQSTTVCGSRRDLSQCCSKAGCTTQQACTSCSAYDEYAKGELCVLRAFDPKHDNVWFDEFDDGLLQDARINAPHVENFKHWTKAIQRRLFMPHAGHRFNDWYQLGRKIGDGASAKVHEASAWAVDATTGSPAGKSVKNVSPRKVAVKVLSLDQHNRRGEFAQEWVGRQLMLFRAEWEVLAQLNHPHIVRLYESFRENAALYIVMEFCQGPELIGYINEMSRQRGTRGLGEDDARNIFRQMLYAGSYLHANHIVHRDMKSENFLFLGMPRSLRFPRARSEKPDVIKLCDFGTAVVLTDRAPRVFGQIGTVSYMSPEICADTGATVLADAWSLGVVLYILLVGAKPFVSKLDDTPEEIMRYIKTGSYNDARPVWKRLSVASKDLVQRLLTVQERLRTSTFDAIQHHWLIPGGALDAMQHQEMLPHPAILENSIRKNASHGEVGLAISQHKSFDDSTGNPNSEPEAPQSSDILTESAIDALRILSQAAVLDPLQRFILSLCAHLSGEGEVLQQSVWPTWYNSFYTLDIKKEGCLDFLGLTQGMRAVLFSSSLPSESQLGAMVRAIDLNLSGAVEWNDWAGAALMSTKSFECKDELLANALRLIGQSADTLPGAQLEADFLPEKGRMEEVATYPSARSAQLRELMRLWINPREDVLTTLLSGSSISPSTPSVRLSDLREILKSTWSANGTSYRQDLSALPARAMVLTSQPQPCSFTLAATALPSMKQGHTVLQGPSVLPSAPLLELRRGYGSGGDSEPNSPRGFYHQSPPADPDLCEEI